MKLVPLSQTDWLSTKTGLLRLCLIGLLLSVLSPALFAQQFTLSGYVKDAENGEALIGARIFVESLAIGTLSNEYGFYSLSVPGDSVEVTFSYIGYNKTVLPLRLTADSTFNLEMKPTMMEEVVIMANSLTEKLNSTQMSVNEVTAAEAKAIPALFGEVDIIKVLQLKPGVQSGGEGFSGLYVRGGGPDQNLVLLDDAPVYNPSHLFGLFSTFNTDAIKNVKLYKGGFPSEYGGKLSSVLDIRMNEGNRKKFSAAGGLGLISSRLTVEGPIVKDKSSFMISGRRTYFDIITREINKINARKERDVTPIPDYFFYDLNAKINYDLGPNDQLYLSGYLGRDVFGFANEDFAADFTWGNATATLRWNHVFSPKVFMKTAFTFSDYNYEIKNQFSVFSAELGSGIRDYNGRADIYITPNPKHNIKVGLSAIHHQFEIGRFQATINSDDPNGEDFNFETGNNLTGNEFGTYYSHEYIANPRLTMNGGLRLSGFEYKGKWYGGLEPRLAGKFSVTDKITAKASYTRMYQYLHMVSNSGASLPTDIWYPSTSLIRPQVGDQVAGGMSFLLGKKYLLTTEGYYKWMGRQIDFRDGAQIFVNPNLEQEFVFGRGYGYGGELYLEKKSGSLTGWIGYTLSWSWREFEAISNGNRFHPRYDRRHDISVVLTQKLGKRWRLTGLFVYGTGNAVSLPVKWYWTQDNLIDRNPNIIPVYTERNGFRMPAYHRADFGVVYDFLPKWGNADLTLSVYNVYNRRNAFFIYIDTEEDADGVPIGFQGKQVSLFPTIPTLTFNFKF